MTTMMMPVRACTRFVRLALPKTRSRMVQPLQLPRLLQLLRLPRLVPPARLSQLSRQSLLTPLTSLALLALPAPQAAAAADWKLISETEDPEKIISWYVDMTSIVHDDDYLRAYLRTSWSVPQYAADRTAYQSSTYLNYFDCDARKIAYTANAYYATAEPEGTPVHQEPEKPVSGLRFQSVVPGSAGEVRLDFVCMFRSKNFLTRAATQREQG